jgi:hypothetical protein
LFTGALDNPTASVYIGSYFNTNNVYQNRLFSVTISNSIGGAPVVDFNPNQYNAANSQTQWVSTSGETWTINVGTATTGYKGVLVDRSIFQLDRVDDSMVTSGSFNLTNDCAVYAVTQQFVTNQTNVIVSYGTSANDYFAFYNESPNRHVFEYFVNPTQKVQRYTGQGTLRCLNADLVNSNVITGYRNNILQATSTNAAPPTPTAAPLVIGRIPATSFYGNFDLTTLIVSNAANSSVQQTSMYNYIRSINGNSF